MSDSPAGGVMTAPIPPGHGGASGAVSVPAPAFTQSARHEQRAAEQEQRTYDRWTTTGKADADYGSMGWRKTHGADAVPTRSDAAKPTPYRARSPWWRWT